MSTIELLKDKHKNMVAYIVGTGPSIKYLTKEYFSDGIVISLNHSIKKISKLNINNIVYSQQKDGNYNGKRICVYPDCYNCKYSVDPMGAILLVHKYESINCFENYEPRYVFSNPDLGLDVWQFSALSAIKIAQYMGCTKLVFVCFDSMNGDYTHFEKESKPQEINDRLMANYKLQKDRQISALKNIKHKYITPTKNDLENI